MDDIDEGGDDACWADRVCAEHGRLDCESCEAVLLDKERGPVPEP